MKQYNKYNIRETDRFTATDFPKVQNELDDLIESLKMSPVANKEDIIVSYIKDHSLKKEWIDDHPGLTTLLTAGHFTTSHMEALFESCRKNKIFLNRYEEYIRQHLSGAS